jgi:cell filamentation protein
LSFDPFNDFETAGYLRNFAAEKDLDLVKVLEHRSFLANLEKALDALRRKRSLAYPDLLKVHRILFEAVYPWAGQDRTKTAPHLAVSR